MVCTGVNAQPVFSTHSYYLFVYLLLLFTLLLIDLFVEFGVWRIVASNSILFSFITLSNFLCSDSEHPLKKLLSSCSADHQPLIVSGFSASLQAAANGYGCRTLSRITSHYNN